MNSTSRILIIDDEPVGRQMLASLLGSPDYEFYFGGNGAEALEQAMRVEPDLILLDVMMPTMDGFEACRRIRAIPTLAEVPIVMVTALDDSESRLQGIEAGADDFLSKPINRAELRARVRTITRLNRHRRLVDARAKFERLFEFSPDGLLILDEPLNIRLANPALCHLLQVAEPSAILSKSIALFVAEDSLTTLVGCVHHCLHTTAPNARCEIALMPADGVTLPVEITVARFPAEDAATVQIAVRDITERKSAEEKIHLQLERLRALNTVGTTLTGNLDLRVMLEVALEQVTQQLGVDAADILLFNEHTQRLEFAAGRGFNSDAFRYTRLKIGEGYAGQAAAERRIISVPNLSGAMNQLRRSPLLSTEHFVAYHAVPLIVKNKVGGVLEILTRAPLTPTPDWMAFLDNLAHQAALAINNAELFTKMQILNLELVEAYDTTLEGWSRALDLRDRETENHTQRVTEMTVHLARQMGMPESETMHLRRGALLHDIGKMGVPDSILLKPGPLTSDERAIMNAHPVYAHQLLAPILFLRPALDIPYCHHEKWDGTGYPRGLQGEAIPLAARIFAIVDVWDALMSDRPYRAAMSKEYTLEYVRSLSGTHFDPSVAQVFLEMVHTSGADIELA